MARSIRKTRITCCFATSCDSRAELSNSINKLTMTWSPMYDNYAVVRQFPENCYKKSLWDLGDSSRFDFVTCVLHIIYEFFSFDFINISFFVNCLQMQCANAIKRARYRISFDGLRLHYHNVIIK